MLGASNFSAVSMIFVPTRTDVAQLFYNLRQHFHSLPVHETIAGAQAADPVFSIDTTLLHS
jgi:hypothetical protein